MRIGGQAPALAVLAVVGAGLAVAASGHWRTGAGVLALALVLGSVLRLALPPPVAGWLVVRSRLFDAALLLGAGIAVLALAVTIPHPAA